jgi:thioredoxin 1
MVLELTKDTFQEQVLGSPIPVLVDFWSPACGPCRMLDPIIKELAVEKEGCFRFVKINAWDEPELATTYRVSGLPTMLIFKDGEIVRSMVGYHDKAQLRKALQEAV